MNFNFSFFWRILLVYAGIFLGGVAAFLWLTNGQIRADLEDQLAEELRVQTELLANQSEVIISSDNQQALATLNNNFSSISGKRFTIIDSQGIVLADSHDNASQMPNHLRRPEIQNAIASGSGQVSRFSQTIGEDLIYYALPVYQQGELRGIVRAAAFTDELGMKIRSQQSGILWKSLIISLVGIVLLAVMAFLQARSVEKLALIASDIADGNFKGRVPEKNALGLRKIAKVINELARNSAANLSDITTDRNRLAAIFAGMVEGVIDVDQNQKILHINDAAAKLLVVNAQESTGKAVWQEVRHNEITQALEEAIKSQSVVKSQITQVFSSGKNEEESVVDIYAASLSDDSGKPIGAVVVLHDISELKSLERIRTDFVANASHELKTPITAIRGLSESVIDDEAIERETVIHFMQRIHSQSLRLSQLVGDLMTLSRLEAAQESDQFSIINMNDLVRNSVISAETAIEGKNQKLNVDITKEKIEVYGDRQNLSQLVDNLIDNANKYTPENGEIFVRLLREGNEMILEVVDTGIGISPQFQQRIFERFYRIDKARSRSLGGTGLGLSIVKNIAEKHDGVIDIKSQQGKGSTFSYRMQVVS
tara:strand:+ start:114 stop:1904 length:1791 start_codon:yes stop_codon:yes gene_type:complete